MTVVQIDGAVLEVALLKQSGGMLHASSHLGLLEYKME